MTRTTGWIGIVAVGLLAGCGWRGGSSRVETGFHQKADLQGVSLVVVETQNGRIDVRCNGSGGEADIAGDKYVRASSREVARQRLDQIQIEAQREADKPEVLRIKASIPKFPDGSAGANFQISLPANLALRLRTSNGSVAAAGARGDVDVRTSNGPVEVEAIEGNLEARTSNAQVIARRIAGDVRAVSSNGDIDIEACGRQCVVARTSNARIRAIDPRGEVTLVSSNGPVELRAPSLASEPQIRIETSNAHVQVEVPRHVRAALDLNTTNARIRADLSGAQVADREDGDDALSAILNGGGGRIDAETSNGPVHFKLIEAQPLTAEAPATFPAGSDQ